MEDEGGRAEGELRCICDCRGARCRCDVADGDDACENTRDDTSDEHMFRGETAAVEVSVGNDAPNREKTSSGTTKKEDGSKNQCLMETGNGSRQRSGESPSS